jgi:putative oxidoreductase
MDKVLGLIGRVLYALPFAFFGLGHLMNADQMAGMVPPYIPGGVIWIYVTGAAMILAAIAIVTSIQARLACFGLVLMLFVFILTIHLPGMMNPAMKMMAMMGLFKDTGLIGGALVIASISKK